MLPYLYIEDHGPTEVLLSGGLGTPFVWDPQLARHVHRFTSIEDFQARARDIINAETQWKIFPGIEAARAIPTADFSALSAIEKIAVVCHETNRAYCAAIGDHSQKSWSEAEAWQRESAIKGVEFSLAHPDAPASAQHDAWTADKLAAGWVYGPVKDAEKKEHPCLVAYAELPAEQKAKDSLFGNIVRALTVPAKKPAKKPAK